MKTLLKNLLKDHPTFILTVSYFFVTLIGIIYSFFYYREFEINILKFADLSDFLLAAMVEPISILIFLAVIVFSLLAFIADFWLRNKYKGYGRWLTNKFAAKYTDPIIYFVVVSILVFLYVRSFALMNAEEVRSGDNDGYIVLFSDSSRGEQQLALLGNSSRFTYLYDIGKDEVLVVPSENISYMKKLAKPPKNQ